MSVKLKTFLKMNCAFNKLTVIVVERYWDRHCFYRHLTNIRELLELVGE